MWFGTKLSHLSFSKHLLHLTCSCYYTNLRRMTAICRHVHSSVFFTIAHAFICSCLENCNSLHVGLPKTCLSSLQSSHKLSGKTHCPSLSHSSRIFTFMTDVLHWLPVTSRIQYKVLLQVVHAQQGKPPKYLCDLM